MKLVYVGGVLDHITLPLSEAFFSLLGDDFRYVASKPFSSSRGDLGYGSLNDRYPFVIKNYEEHDRAQKAIDDADVVIFGSAPEELVSNRMRCGKLTFRYTERMYKEPFTVSNALHRVLGAWRHHGIYQNKNVHILCAGAYVSYDFSRYHYYKDRFYKWCYFTKVSDKSFEDLRAIKSENKTTEIVWTARFLPLKHPEMVIRLARYLKDHQADFHVTMLGGGEAYDETVRLAETEEVADCITFTGAAPPDVVRDVMEHADISLFTSDRGEGWGAVVNEAMGSACAVVASSAAGSPPFLIEHLKNGILFDIEEPHSFYRHVLELVKNKEKQRELGEKAYEAIHRYWTPENAARSFLSLAEGALRGKITPPHEGPCSRAPVLKDGWFKEQYHE